MSSCSCNNHYFNLPCCCFPTGTTTTTTTTICEGGEPCEESIKSDCVTYTGTDLVCYLIFSGMTLTEVLEIIMTQLLTCAPCTTTTTTGAPVEECDCYTVTNNETNPGVVVYSMTYVDCFSGQQTISPFTEGSTQSVCAVPGSISLNFSATIVDHGLCGLNCPPLEP